MADRLQNPYTGYDSDDEPRAEVYPLSHASQKRNRRKLGMGLVWALSVSAKEAARDKWLRKGRKRFPVHGPVLPGGEWWFPQKEWGDDRV